MTATARRIIGADGIARWHSVGRILLVAAARQTAPAEIARRLRVSRAAVSTWVTGLRNPESYRVRRDLQAEFGIPMVSWDIYGDGEP